MLPDSSRSCLRLLSLRVPHPCYGFPAAASFVILLRYRKTYRHNMDKSLKFAAKRCRASHVAFVHLSGATIWLHRGKIASQRVALHLIRYDASRFE